MSCYTTPYYTILYYTRLYHTILYYTIRYCCDTMDRMPIQRKEGRVGDCTGTPSPHDRVGASFSAAVPIFTMSPTRLWSCAALALPTRWRWVEPLRFCHHHNHTGLAREHSDGRGPTVGRLTHPSRIQLRTQRLHPLFRC